MPTKLVDMDIDFVSLVDRGANQKRFAVLKAAGNGGRAPKQEAAMTVAKTGEKYQHALAAGIAKGRGQGGFLARLRKTIAPKRHVAKSANDMVSLATWALSYVLDLIEDESAGMGDMMEADAAEDQADIDTLKQIAELLSTYIGSTAQEVGSPEDLADSAEEAVAYAQMMASQYPMYMRDGGRPDVAKVGQKQFSASRVARLEEAADSFAAVLDEIKAEQSDDDESSKAKKRAQPEEVDMTGDELAKALETAIAKANQPLMERLEAIEKAGGKPAAEPVDKGDLAGDGEVTMRDVAVAIGKLSDRLALIEKARGERQSQSGGDLPGGVKKHGVFTGVLSDA